MSDKSQDQGRPEGSGPEGPRVQPRAKRRWLRRILLAFFLLLATGAGVVWHLLGKQPAHWASYWEFVEKTPPHEIKKLAQSVKDKFSALGRLGLDPRTPGGLPGEDSGIWINPQTTGELWAWPETITTLQLSTLELNAWMNDEFDQWMKYQGYVKPEAIHKPAIAMEADGSMLAAFEYQSDYLTQIFNGKCDLVFKPDGKAIMTIGEYRAGELPLPVGTIGDYLRKQAPNVPAAAEAADWLDKLKEVEFRPMIKLENGRKAHMTALKPKNGGVEITMRIAGRKRTEPELAEYRRKQALERDAPAIASPPVQD